MKLQFVYGNYEDYVYLDVDREPTKEETKAIYDSIYEDIEWWVERYDSLDDFDFWQCCYRSVNKYLNVINNPVVKTFYIDRVED